MAYAEDDIDDVVACADKIIFNSLSQLERYAPARLGYTAGAAPEPRHQRVWL